MKTANVVQFFIETDPEGGYTAQAVGYSIYTQGDTLDETVSNIKEAVACHFSEADGNISHSSVPIVVNFALPAMA